MLDPIENTLNVLLGKLKIAMSDLRENNNRLIWVDWAKAFGLIFVILMHIYFIDVQFRRYIVVSIIPFFFFLSGYLFKPPSNFGEYARKNFNALIAPYLLYNAIMFIYFAGWAYFFRRANFDATVEKMTVGFLFGSNSFASGELPCVPSWFLLALFWVKIFVGAACVRRKYVLYAFLWIVALTAIFLCDKNIPYHLDSAIYCLPFFIAGYFLKVRGAFKLISRFRGVSFLLFLATAVCFFCAVNHNVFINFNICSFHTNLAVIFLLPLIGVFMLIFFAQIFNGMSLRAISTIAAGSTFIFCFHPIFLSWFYFLMNKLGINGANFNVCAPIMIAFGCMILSYPCIILAKKYLPILLGKAKILGK